MPITTNEEAFARLGQERATRLVATLAWILDETPLAEFDLDAIGNTQRSLLFELCFFAIAVFEDRGGVDEAGETYYPRLAFETRTSSGEPNLLLGPTPVHGLLEDPILNAGLSSARLRANDRSN